MMDKSISDNINPADKIGPMKPVGEDQHDSASNTQAFSTYMQNNPAVDTGTNKAQMISPFDLAQQGPKTGMPTPNVNTIMSQVQLAQNSMSDLHSQLSYPDLKLKASQKYIVKNKLTDANASLRAANARLGSNNILGNQPHGNIGGPLGTFLNYVTDGMNQLDSAKQQLTALKTQGHNLTPADFLMIQIKMNKAQQEIDFTSTLLGKCVDDFKQIMNIQL